MAIPSLSLIFGTLFLDRDCLSANDAAAAGGVLYGMTYMPYIFVQLIYDRLGRGVKLVSCLLPNMAMGFACQIIAQFEAQGTDVTPSLLSTVMIDTVKFIR